MQPKEGLDYKMTAIGIKQTSWNITCKVCEVSRNVLLGAWMSTIAFTETAGRARAAAALTQMGRYEEARNLMLNKDVK